jgi:hypothetical protein
MNWLTSARFVSWITSGSVANAWACCASSSKLMHSSSATCFVAPRAACATTHEPYTGLPLTFATTTSSALAGVAVIGAGGPDVAGGGFG